MFTGIFLLISIVSVYAAGQDTDAVSFNMQGCSDRTLIGICSATPPMFCFSDLILKPKCCRIISGQCVEDECGCPREKSWCKADKNDCAERPPNLKCIDQTLTKCKDYWGVCFVNYTETPNKCKECPEKLSNPPDCSFYQKQEECEQDMCFLGKTGLGYGFYESQFVIVNYSCEWDPDMQDAAGNIIGGCTLGYSTFDTTSGNVSRCRTTQKLGPCSNDSAILTWTKKCTRKDPVTGIVKVTESGSGQSPIACGRAASPIPFFTALNAAAVSIILISYYLFIFRKKRISLLSIMA